MNATKKEWTREEIGAVYHSPILDLIFRAAKVHREHHDPREIQVCTLLSIKTGGCPEDCKYCAQSARYNTSLERHALLDLEAVVAAAQKARENGSTRFCMGAAWRQVRDGEDFERTLQMVREVSSLGLEVCCTLGMLTEEQAQRLKDAGLHAYNHNLDTGEEYYADIVGTHTFAERLRTLQIAGKAGISVCCGGILGMGESTDDRLDFLHALTTLVHPPESVPINALVPIPGTPLQDLERIPVWELVRMIASARILLPAAMVRLAAGRDQLSATDQALCFLAGSNSIFSGDKLLTTPHPGAEKDAGLLELLDLRPKTPCTEAG